MFIKSSPYAKKMVASAMKRMQAGISDKAPTRAETEARLATRKKKSEAEQMESAKRDAANLESLEKEHAKSKAEYERLGGKSYQYADKQQNLSESERKAQGMESGMSAMQRRIDMAKKAGSMKKGGAISLKDCKVSTADKGKNKSHW